MIVAKISRMHRVMQSPLLKRDYSITMTRFFKQCGGRPSSTVDGISKEGQARRFELVTVSQYSSLSCARLEVRSSERDQSSLCVCRDPRLYIDKPLPPE